MNKKIYIVSAILTFLGLVVYFATRRKASATPAASDPLQPAQGPQAPPVIANREPADTWPLMRGKSTNNKYVKDIQKALNTRYQEDLPLTGNFYAQTEAALKRHSLPTVIYIKDWYEITSGKPWTM